MKVSLILKITITQLIQTYSLQYGVNPTTAVSVAYVESGLNHKAIGITGDLGVFQLKPKSFPRYSKKELLDPIVNVQLGVQYLARLKKLYPDRYLVAWNYGPTNAKKVRYPKLFPYVKKVAIQEGGSCGMLCACCCSIAR